MNQPIFILGVGAQKAGTTWVSEYLRHQKDIVDTGEFKEYHIWDAWYNPHGLFDEFQAWNPQKFHLSYKMQHVTNFYESYFKSLIKNNVRITGDITPSYCALSHDNFLEIKNRLERVGFLVKVIFIMRDPVNRCWSASKMMHRDAEQYFEKHYNSLQFQIRTKYEITLEQLDKTFAPNNLYIGIYESMFEDSNILKLSKFCNVDFNPNFRVQRFNSTRSQELDPELGARCYEFYKPTYDYIEKRFPEIKSLWSAHLVSRT